VRLVDPALASFLDTQDLDYCLIGGIALAAWGHARFTADVDLLTLDERILRREFWLDADLPPPQIRIGELDDPLGGVVRIPLDPVHDLILGKGHATALALRGSVPRAGLPCPVASPLGLIALKLEAGGPQDAYDILALLGDSGLEPTVEQELPSLSREAQVFWMKIQSLR
jgi:hypothetical protein